MSDSNNNAHLIHNQGGYGTGRTRDRSTFAKYAQSGYSKKVFL